jgi:hypothetical protein
MQHGRKENQRVVEDPIGRDLVVHTGANSRVLKTRLRSKVSGVNQTEWSEDWDLRFSRRRVPT